MACVGIGSYSDLSSVPKTGSPGSEEIQNSGLERFANKFWPRKPPEKAKSESMFTWLQTFTYLYKKT